MYVSGALQSRETFMNFYGLLPSLLLIHFHNDLICRRHEKHVNSSHECCNCDLIKLWNFELPWHD